MPHSQQTALYTHCYVLSASKGTVSGTIRKYSACDAALVNKELQITLGCAKGRSLHCWASRGGEYQAWLLCIKQRRSTTGGCSCDAPYQHSVVCHRMQAGYYFLGTAVCCSSLSCATPLRCAVHVANCWQVQSRKASGAQSQEPRSSYMHASHM